MKPPRPLKKLIIDNSINKEGICLTKKDRLKIDRNVEVQKENRIMLQKLLEIDQKKSQLNKRRIKPVVFKIRSLSACKQLSNHPQLKLNARNHVEELKQIGEENKIILRKLKEVKSGIDYKKIDKEQRKMHNLSVQMSQNAGRIPKHPFFQHDNPASTFYRETLNKSNSDKLKLMKDYRQFCQSLYQEKDTKALTQTMNGFDNLTHKLILKKKNRRKFKMMNPAQSYLNNANNQYMSEQHQNFFAQSLYNTGYSKDQNTVSDSRLAYNNSLTDYQGNSNDAFSNLNSMHQFGKHYQSPQKDDSDSKNEDENTYHTSNQNYITL